MLSACRRRKAAAIPALYSLGRFPRHSIGGEKIFWQRFIGRPECRDSGVGMRRIVSSPTISSGPERRLIVSDIDGRKRKTSRIAMMQKSSPPDQILFVECDILAPCASRRHHQRSDDPAISLQSDCRSGEQPAAARCHGVALKERGILYAPDFVINGGGLLNVAAELEETGYSPSFSRAKIHRIYDCLLAIYDIAEKNQRFDSRGCDRSGRLPDQIWHW